MPNPRKPPRKSASDGRGERKLKVRLKSRKKRSVGSTAWLERQLNDPYVADARRLGYRSRSAFKLLEIDDRFEFLQPGGRVVDLGAAPGGWSQVSAARVRAEDGPGRVVAIDLHAIGPIGGVAFLKKDFYDADAPAMIMAALGEARADVVLSDMAAHATGHRQTDHLKIMGLCDAALAFAREILKPDGVFLCKVLRGGTESDLLTLMKQDFKSVRHIKPAASRDDSAELYVLATGFRGVFAEPQ